MRRREQIITRLKAGNQDKSRESLQEYVNNLRYLHQESSNSTSRASGVREYDFSSSSYDHRNIYRKTYRFNICIFILYVCYSFSFVMDNRSDELMRTHEAIWNHLSTAQLNSSDAGTGSYRTFADISNMFQAIDFAHNTMDMIYDPIEPQPNVSFRTSPVVRWPRDDNKTYLDFKFVQQSNLLLASRIAYNQQKPVYFSGNESLTSVLQQLMAEESQLSSIPSLLTLEIIFYNINIETSVYYNISMKGKSNCLERYFRLPSYFDYRSRYFQEMVPILVVRVLFLIYILSYSFDFVVRKLYKILKPSFKMQIFILYDIVFISLNLAYYYFYISLVVRTYSGKFIISSNDEFDDWIMQAREYRNMFRVIGILVLINLVKIIEMLHYKFYNLLRILFLSFKFSTSDLFGYGLLICILMVFFVSFKALTYHTTESMTDTIINICMSLYSSAVRSENCLLNHDGPLGNRSGDHYNYMVFIAFYLVAIRFLIAIISYHFSKYHQKYQIAVEVFEKWEKVGEATDFSKLIDIFIFRYISGHEKELSQSEVDVIRERCKRRNLEEHRMVLRSLKGIIERAKGVHTLHISKTKRKHDQETQATIKEKEARMKKTRIANQIRSRKIEEEYMNRINMKTILYNNIIEYSKSSESKGGVLLVRDEYVGMLLELEKEVKEKKERKIKEELGRIDQKVISQIRRSLMYIIYIILHIYVTETRLQIRNSFELSRYFSASMGKNASVSGRQRSVNLLGYLSTTNFTEIRSLSDYQAWLADVS